MSAIEDFDEEYASPSEWAKMYREHGLQVVPAHSPETSQNYKRPALKQWTQYTKEIVSDEIFKSWYGVNGQHAHRNNMGFITGSASGGVFIIDLDTHKNDAARQWWESIHAEHNMGFIVETPVQTTGGGGKQYFFRAPKGWVSPTIKTSIGVDIRGEGGFAMLPPSNHESGNLYKFDDGFGINDCELVEAPEWLCDEVDILAAQNGHIAQAPLLERDATPKSQTSLMGINTQSSRGAAGPYVYDAFGGVKDGREDYMTKMVWAKVVDLHREYPGRDFDEKSHFMSTFQTYVDHVEPRLSHPTLSKADLLENESRGITLFKQKWRKAMAKWDTKVSQHASVENPKKPEGVSKNANPEKTSDEIRIQELSSEFDSQKKGERKLFKFYDVDEIMEFPDPKFLIEDRILENSFFLIVGPPGCGKTFVALSMALSISTGQSHWWSAEIQRSGPVIYISSEGRSDLKFRIGAWGMELDVDARGKQFRLLDQSVNFTDPAAFLLLIDSLKDLIENDLKERPAAIIIDTVSRAIPGADENLQKDMTPFLEKCGILQRVFDTAVGGVHHTNRSGGLRGSTVFDGGADEIIMVRYDHESGEGSLFYHKIKASRDHWSEPFELKEIVVRPGIKPKTSLVAIPAKPEVAAPQSQDASQEGYGGRQETNKEPDLPTCRKMVEAIHEAWLGGYPWSRDSKSDRWAAQKLSDSFGFPVEVCEKFVGMWWRGDVIVTDTWGEKGNKKGLRRGRGL